jgi:hypothetical protein
MVLKRERDEVEAGVQRRKASRVLPARGEALGVGLRDQRAIDIELVSVVHANVPACAGDIEPGEVNDLADPEVINVDRPTRTR